MEHGSGALIQLAVEHRESQPVINYAEVHARTRESLGQRIAATGSRPLRSLWWAVADRNRTARKLLYIGCLLALCAPAALCFAQPPHGVGGFAIAQVTVPPPSGAAADPMQPT